METAEKKRVTLILGIAAGVLAAVLAVMCVLCLPYFGKPADALASQPTHPPTEPPTEVPTVPPTEPEPTLPPPEDNPYGQLDFQYEGRFLKSRDGKSITGIDVSAYQHEIDWEQVRDAGVEFAMIRLGYRGYESGKIVEDKYAKANLNGAAAAGVEVGVYFFSQAVSVEEAVEEAQYVIDFISGYDIAMPVVYDWERVSNENARTKDVDRRTLTDCSLAFLQAIEEAGYWPMLYFNTHQSRTLLYLAELKDYDFWLALYSNRMTFPYKIKMWQYTCTGRIPGIEGDTDINIFFTDT